MDTKALLRISTILVSFLPTTAMAEQNLSTSEATTTVGSKWSDLSSFKIGDIFSGRLGGEVLFAPTMASGGDPPGKGKDDFIPGYLAQFQLTGSFTGDRDVLRLGFAVGDFDGRGFAEQRALNTNMALLSYQFDSQDLTTLEYRYAAFNNRVVFTIKPIGFGLNSVLTPNSDYLSASRGALSRFAGASPIYKIGSLRRGLGIDFWQSRRARLQLAAGFRDSDHYALAAQYLLKPTENLTTSLAYVYAFSEDGTLSTFTGSHNADTSGGFDEPSDIHALNMALRWRFHPKLTFGSWFGAAFTDSRDSDAKALSTTFLVSLGLSDPFGRKGDSVAFMAGQSPRLVVGQNIVREDEGFGMHYEAFYNFNINKHFSITPGLFYVTEPGHISDNDDILIASVRAAFRF